MNVIILTIRAATAKKNSSSVDQKSRSNLCKSRRTCFSPNRYLLMALVDDPVRSFKAKMASVISVRVVMMLIGIVSLEENFFYFQLYAFCAR